MTITKKQTVLVLPIILLLLLALTPPASAQEQTAVTEPGVVGGNQAVANELTREQSLNRVQELANNINYKLLTAVAGAEQIVGRLNSRLEKDKPSNEMAENIKILMEEAEMSLANATDLLENIGVDIDGLLEVNDLRVHWQSLEFRFMATADEIRNAKQNIAVVADILLLAATGDGGQSGVR